MNYQESAQELLSVMMRCEHGGRLIPASLSEFARGELAVLVYLTEGNNGVSAFEISRRFQINTSRVAAILNSLCKKGYVIRKTHPQDKRKICVYYTEEGRSVAENRRREILDNISGFLMRLGEADAREHIRIMKRISELVQSME